MGVGGVERICGAHAGTGTAPRQSVSKAARAHAEAPTQAARVARARVFRAQVRAGQPMRMPPALAKGAWPPAPRASLEAVRALAPAARALARAAEASP